MAVRFPGTAGNFFARSSDLPALANFTVCWWMKYASSVTNRNNPFTIHIDGSSAIYYQTSGASGTQLQYNLVGNGSNVLTLVDIGIGNWYFFALAISGQQVDNYYAALGADTLTLAQSFASSSTWWTPTNMRLSQRPDTFGRIDGTLANVKIWQASLSKAELEAERRALRPHRRANLYAWYPMVDPGANARTRDMSGLSRDWTQTGTVTDEAGPPLAYGSELTIWRAIPVATLVVPPVPAFRTTTIGADDRDTAISESRVVIVPAEDREAA
jgi:hypothetical protein